MTIIACSTDGCTRAVKVKKRALCGACYIRWQRYTGRAKKEIHAQRCAVSFPTCEFCSRLFSSKTRRQVRACPAASCQRKLKSSYQRLWFDAYREANGVSYAHERYADQRKAHQIKRRMAVGAECESFSAHSVFIRDKWVCQLCFEAVDASLVWPDPMSASLDHIVPLSRGGNHTEANSQLAHVRCNCSKGNRDGVPNVATRKKTSSGGAKPQ